MINARDRHMQSFLPASAADDRKCQRQAQCHRRPDRPRRIGHCHQQNRRHQARRVEQRLAPLPPDAAFQQKVHERRCRHRRGKASRKHARRKSRGPTSPPKAARLNCRPVNRCETGQTRNGGRCPAASGNRKSSRPLLMPLFPTAPTPRPRFHAHAHGLQHQRQPRRAHITAQSARHAMPASAASAARGIASSVMNVSGWSSTR